MSEHPAAALYSPTPIEEAYAIYVYDALFGNLPPDGSIHLEARATLKILEKSDVDAIILRTIWSVADPDGVRCLTHISQFHVVLRLVALAQDGLLEKEINRAFTQQRNQTTPVTVFKKTLWMSQSYTDCPLPSFTGVAMPTKDFLETLSNRLRGIHELSAPAPVLVPAPAPAPAPTPIPISTRKAAPTPLQASSPAPAAKPQSTLQPLSKLKTPPIQFSDEIPNEISIKKKPSQSPTGIESAIQQMETLGVSTPNPNIKNLKELDPENFELYQEQTALERAIMESQQSTRAKPTIAKPPDKAFSHGDMLSEEEALQKAIYESTHAASPPRPSKSVAAAPPKKEEHQNWLRMSSQDSSSEFEKDSDSDDEYKKKKTPKGDTYTDYVTSLDPSNGPTATQKKGKADQSENSEEFDKKPAAKPSPKSLEKPPVSKPPPSPKKQSDDTVDEYPQAVQELVMNGFELQKAIQGYKMLGDNFDDIVLFLTSNVTVKELVINGFNIHKVVQAYELIGDNMDDLLAYLMANAT